MIVLYYNIHSNINKTRCTTFIFYEIKRPISITLVATIALNIHLSNTLNNMFGIVLNFVQILVNILTRVLG